MICFLYVSESGIFGFILLYVYIAYRLSAYMIFFDVVRNNYTMCVDFKMSGCKGVNKNPLILLFGHHKVSLSSS